MPRRTQLEIATERNEVARLHLDTALAKRKTSVLAAAGDAGPVRKAPAAKYHLTEPNKHRKQPTVERTNEDGVYPQRKRLKGAAVARDIERNLTTAHGALHQCRINSVGSLGKLQLNIPDDKGKEAQDYFNEVYAKECDARDDVHWSTNLQNIIAAVVREGDLVSAVDDGAFFDDGKLWFWESDQICPMAAGDFKARFGDKAKQENGIVRDPFGRVMGWLVSSEHGAVERPASELMLVPRGVGRHLKRTTRLNQGRGIGPMLTAGASFQDLYEINSSELETAKYVSKIAGMVTRTDAMTDPDNPGDAPELLPENTGQSAAEVAEQAVNGGSGTAYERFEALTGGHMEYMGPNEKFELLKIDRPNVHLEDFNNFVAGSGGAAMGLARAYVLLRADSSYTSFRGDMLLSWATFYELQKWLERSYCDWVGKRVLGWAERTGEIGALPGGWQRAIGWQWPTMPEVDPWKHQQGKRMALKNGDMTYREMLGPNWRGKLKQLAEELAFIKENDLPLSVLETITGIELQDVGEK